MRGSTSVGLARSVDNSLDMLVCSQDPSVAQLLQQLAHSRADSSPGSGLCAGFEHLGMPSLQGCTERVTERVEVMLVCFPNPSVAQMLHSLSTCGNE